MKKVNLFFLIGLLLANKAFGIVSLQNNLAQYHKYDNPPKNTTINSTCLVGLFDYYFMKNNQKNCSAFQPKKFPLEKLPKDIQNEIASYLPFEFELINRLNNSRKKEKEGFPTNIIFQGHDLKIKITNFIATLISKKNANKTTLIDISGDGFERSQGYIINAEVSPDFQQFLLHIYDGWHELIAINLKQPDLRFHWKPGHTIKHMAITNDGNNIATANPYCIYIWYREKKDCWQEEYSMANKEAKIVEKLEFNNQGTKLGVKYKDGSIKIIPFLCKKKEEKETLANFFRRNIITKNLKHYASDPETSLDEID